MSSESIISIFVVVVVIFGIISDLISNLGRKEYARSISLFLLSIFTIGVYLSDILVKGNLYSELKFILFDHDYFAPLMFVYSFYTLYKSVNHCRHFTSKFAIILLINATFIFLLSLVNIFVVWEIIKNYPRSNIISICYILIVLGICSTIQFIVGELEIKRIQKLQQQKQEDVPIPTPVSNEGDMDEN